MEFRNITKHSLSVSSFCILFSSYVTILSPVFALNKCDFPAIFNFGASNADTGGFSAAFSPVTSPNGMTHFHMPVGRLSDGRLIIDFIGESFNLSYLHPYLDSVGSNFTHGANFAVSGSTIRTSDIPDGGSSPFNLKVQYSQFRQFKSRSHMIKKLGGAYAYLMPKEEYFGEALYTFDIGQNDLSNGFFANYMNPEKVNASVPDIVYKFSTIVKKIYSLGARSFWIHNTGPIGCLPLTLAIFPLAQKDSVGCAKPYNDVAQYFNLKLKQAIVQLRNEFPSAAFTYVDIYSVKYSLFTEPSKYGFELPLVACCSGGCRSRTVMVNGTKVFAGLCKRPSVRVIWDGLHYTEAANKFVFDQISTGAFSDPPLPLQMACHRA